MKKEFLSQVCTTRFQSEALLKLGLKKETADMCHQVLTLNGEPVTIISPDVWTDEQEIYDSHYPAWSLHRLMEMYGNNYNYIWFQNAYSELIHAISISIEDGTFNKDYLEEKK